MRSLSFPFVLLLLPAVHQCSTSPCYRSIKHHSPSKGTLRISHEASIELATKVTDTAEKLKHTLAHELCHLAAWYIESEMKPPHGRGFKLWCVFLPFAPFLHSVIG